MTDDAFKDLAGRVLHEESAEDVSHPDILTMFHVPDDESFSLYLEVRLDTKDVVIDRNADELLIPLAELDAWINSLTRARALLMVERGGQ